jgi:hypothetical protein
LSPIFTSAAPTTAVSPDTATDVPNRSSIAPSLAMTSCSVQSSASTIVLPALECSIALRRRAACASSRHSVLSTAARRPSGYDVDARPECAGAVAAPAFTNAKMEMTASRIVVLKVVSLPLKKVEPGGLPTIARMGRVLCRRLAAARAARASSRTAASIAAEYHHRDEPIQLTALADLRNGVHTPASAQFR